jgi:Transposase IS66 family
MTRWCAPPACGRCGAVTAGQPPPGITGRAQYGPEAHAQAANLASTHYIPVGRAAQLKGEVTGLPVSAGWMAGVRHKAARRLEPFMDRVRVLLREAGVLYADETPARAAGRLEYVHVACTGYLTAMHTGGRSAADIDITVLFVEAGGLDTNPLIAIPRGFAELLGDSTTTWHYPPARLDHRSGSSIGCSATRGGGWDDLLPVFKAIEDNDLGESDVRGAGRPAAHLDRPRDRPAARRGDHRWHQARLATGARPQ